MHETLKEEGEREKKKKNEYAKKRKAEGRISGDCIMTLH
jgi:hypothetical protein